MEFHSGLQIECPLFEDVTKMGSPLMDALPGLPLPLPVGL